MIARAVLLAVVAAAAGATAPAASAIGLRDVGPAPEVVHADTRYVATTDADGPTVRVWNVRTGHRETFPTPSGCVFAAIGGGSVLWNCATPDRPGYGTALVRDLRTGRYEAHRPPGDATRPVGDASWYTGVGRRWVRVVTSGYHWSFSRYVDRQTGAVRDFAWRDRRVVPDLDRVGLARRLCRGLAAPLVPNDDTGMGLVRGSLARVGRVAAATTYEDRVRADRFLVHRVELRRCGRPRRVLSHCGGRLCSEAVTDGRVVAWIEDGVGVRARLRVHRVATGRTRTRSLSRRDGPPRIVGVVAGRLLVASGGRLLRVSTADGATGPISATGADG